MNTRNKMNSNMNTEGEIVKIKGLPRKKRKKIRNQNMRYKYKGQHPDYRGSRKKIKLERRKYLKNNGDNFPYI